MIAGNGIGTLAILLICNLTTGLCVPKEEAIEGLDDNQHGETMRP